jgi:UDP-glucose 4-epimerase
MKRALVLGGNGFIGSHLTDELLRLGWDVTVLDFQNRRYDPTPASVHFIHGSHTQSYLVREALAGVDTVFHLAWATIHEVSNEDPAADVVANLVPSIHLLEACRQQGIRRIVFTSSGGTVYGPARQLPIVETHPKNPINAYGISKLAVEKYLEMFHHLYGLEYAILRPSVPYGPRQNPLGRQGAAAVFLYRVAQGLPVTIWGDGHGTRDYFYISDLVRALVAAGECELDGNRTFNIGGSEEVSLNCLLEQVEKTVGKKAIVEYQSGRKFDAARIVLDTSAAREHLGWRPEVPLDEGLRRTWEWMAANFDFTEHTSTHN